MVGHLQHECFLGETSLPRKKEEMLNVVFQSREIYLHSVPKISCRDRSRDERVSGRAKGLHPRLCPCCSHPTPASAPASATGGWARSFLGTPLVVHLSENIPKDTGCTEERWPGPGL